MENRNVRHHRERLADTMREEIAAIVEGELSDPRIGLASVTGVQLTPDGRGAHVLIALQGQDPEETLDGLESAKGYIRREVADRMRLRSAPELHFAVDRSQELHGRVDQLLTRMKKREKK